MQKRQPGAAACGTIQMSNYKLLYDQGDKREFGQAVRYDAAICRYENFEIEETINKIDKEINKNVNEKISKKVDENKLLVIEILNKLMEGKYE